MEEKAQKLLATLQKQREDTINTLRSLNGAIAALEELLKPVIEVLEVTHEGTP